MKYKYILPTLCIFGTISMHAEESGGLGDILQGVGEKKALVKPDVQKKKSKKKSRFIFKDAYQANGIGSKDPSATADRSQSYEYDNRSRFEFKFNGGSQQSNLVGGSMGGSGGSMGGGKGSGGGRR